MNTLELKRKLLETNVVIDNEYLINYLELIKQNMLTEPEKGKTQIHHILPKSYYKHFNIEVDNNSRNKVNLYLKDHILAHYYLYKCSACTWFKFANLCAVQYCLNSSKTSIDIDLQQLLTNFDEFEKDRKILFSQNLKENHYCGRGIPLSQETKEKISRAKTNPSELVRKHLSEAHKGKKPSAESLKKRSIALKLAHANKLNNGYLNRGTKISETKQKNKSGNNRAEKIHIKNYNTGQEKYIMPANLDLYIEQGFEKFRPKYVASNRTKTKKVLCIETNIIYNSIKEAEESLNIHCVGAACRGARKTAGGYHWQFI